MLHTRMTTLAGLGGVGTFFFLKTFSSSVCFFCISCYICLFFSCRMGCRCFWDSDTDNFAQDIYMNVSIGNSGVILEGDLGEKVSLNWLTPAYLELREK